MPEPPHDLLLDDYLEEWLERRRSHIRPTTHAGYRQAISSYVLPSLAGTQLVDIDRRTLERLYARLLARGGQGGKPLSPRTVQLTHAVLHRALADAQLDGLLDDNPAAIARPPRRDPTETVADDDLHIWTPEQVAAFLTGIDDHPLRAVWHVAVGTGGRRGEVLGLRWQDVDLEGRTICIRRSLTVVDGVARLLGTKTSRTRTLSIDSVVADALRRERSDQQRRREAAGRDWTDEWGLVFTDAAGSPVQPIRVTHEFRRLTRELDVPVIRMHDLRHTHASLLLAQGAPIKLVSERLGHSTISMTMDTYAHLLPAMDEDAVDELEERIHGPVGERRQ